MSIDRGFMLAHVPDWLPGVFCQNCGCEGHRSCAQSKLAWAPGWHDENCCYTTPEVAEHLGDRE